MRKLLLLATGFALGSAVAVGLAAREQLHEAPPTEEGRPPAPPAPPMSEAAPPSGIA